MLSNQKGQTLLELIVVSAVSIIIIGALVFATISSLRNAQFSKNQAQATKLAQQGIETVRSLRDRNGLVSYNTGSSFTSQFSDLWPISFSCPTNNCYFNFNSSGGLVGGSSDTSETVSTNFKRQIIIEDEGSGNDAKKVTVTVSWTDFAGPHESRLTTILRKL